MTYPYSHKISSIIDCFILLMLDLVCTLAFCPYPHADPILFTGKTSGKIVAPVPGRYVVKQSFRTIFIFDDIFSSFICNKPDMSEIIARATRE